MTFSYFLFIIPINTITHLIIIGKYIRIFQTKTILISFFLNFLLFYKFKGLFFIISFIVYLFTFSFFFLVENNQSLLIPKTMTKI